MCPISLPVMESPNSIPAVSLLRFHVEKPAVLQGRATKTLVISVKTSMGQGSAGGSRGLQ